MQILVDCPEYKMDAVTFFRSAMPSLAKLCAQLLKHIGLALEASLAASSTDKSKKGSMKSVGFAMKTFEDCLEENEDRALAMYVLAGVQASANKTVFFLGTDKGNNTGLPLQNTAICMNTNELILCAPVVGGGNYRQKLYEHTFLLIERFR